MTQPAEVVALARGLVHDLAAGLAAEQRLLPPNVCGYPSSRHYEIDKIRETLATLDRQIAGLAAAPGGVVRRLRAAPFKDISAARCYRCGAGAMASWSTCAAGSGRLALCLACDLGLNRVALGYVLGMDAAAALVSGYERRLHERLQNTLAKGLRDKGRRRIKAASAGRQRAKASARQGKVDA